LQHPVYIECNILALNQFLYWPEPADDNIISLPFDLHFDFFIFVGDLMDAKLILIDNPLQGLHVTPVHPCKIVSLKDHFNHGFANSLPDIMDNQPERLSILCDACSDRSIKAGHGLTLIFGVFIRKH
jgi:hypothetical protein